MLNVFRQRNDLVLSYVDVYRLRGKFLDSVSWFDGLIFVCRRCVGGVVVSFGFVRLERADYPAQQYC